MVIKYFRRKIFLPAAAFIFLFSSEILIAQHINYNDTFTLYYPGECKSVSACPEYILGGAKKNGIIIPEWEELITIF